MKITFTPEELSKFIAEKLDDIIRDMTSSTSYYIWNDEFYNHLDDNTKFKINELRDDINRGCRVYGLENENTELREKVSELQDQIKQMQTPLYKTLNPQPIDPSSAPKWWQFGGKK